MLLAHAPSLSIVRTLVEETSACFTLLFPLSVLESCGPIAASKAIAAA